MIFIWLLSKWHSGKESTYKCKRCKRCGFNPWVRKIPWSRERQSVPIFLHGKFHGEKSLGGYSPWGHKESDTTEHAHITERAHIHASIYNILPSALHLRSLIKWDLLRDLTLTEGPRILPSPHQFYVPLPCFIFLYSIHLFSSVS